LSKSKVQLQQRVITAAERLLESQGHISFLELLMGLNWLSPNAEAAWRHGRIEHLADDIHGGDLALPFQHFAEWAASKGLEQRQAVYTRAGRAGAHQLRIFPAGQDELEAIFRTQFVSPAKREALQKKETKDAQPVVFSIVRDSTCSECGAELWKGDLLFMDGQQPLCLACAGMGELEYLPRGDVAMTRRATRYSSRTAVVVRFSRSRGRYERQGILVEPEAIARAEQECAADAGERAQARARAAVARAQEDREFADHMTSAILALLPGCPPDEAHKIAEHTATRGTGRVGRSAAGRALQQDTLMLAVRASIRHRHTNYDELLAKGVERQDARDRVRDRVAEIVRQWGG